MLQSIKINGLIFGVEIFTCTPEQLNGREPFIFSDIIQDGYGDMSVQPNYIELLYKYGVRANKDYKYIRNEIMVAVWTKILNNINKWNLLTQVEKEIASEWFTVPKVLRDTIHSFNQQIENGKIFDKESTACRINRYNDVRVELFNRLSWENAMELLGECKLLVESYQQGKEGTEEGDGEGLFDYIESRPGTSHENSGLLQKQYQVVGFNTMEEFSIKLMDILKKGNY